ncbi:MAG: FAD-dependent tricarballylate dehydrogenase TcuA [Deltaproteobacteria bacterium]|nr:FAD-dependent tricarballylate dehydrogenase TcuA [Deltaproteobacteria bacterium]
MAILKELETDVLVIGAGNAALVAAETARDAGMRVTVLERAPKERRGGNSAFSGGLFRFAYQDFEQVKEILKGTPGIDFKDVDVEPYPTDMFYGDLMRVTEGLADPILSEMLVTRSQEVLTWMAKHGIDWELHMSHVAKVKGKYIWRSGTIPVSARGGGHGLQEMHFKHVENRGIEVLYRTRALEFSQDQSGAVDGALVSTPSGKQLIKSKAVVLACGGFESNPEMRARYLGQNWDLVKVRGTRYNTGDGITMATDVGASPFGHWSGCHASVIDAEAAAVEAATDESTRYSYPFSIMVNMNGERFVDEGEDFQVYTYAKTGRRILAQPGQIAYQIYDQKTVPLLRSTYMRARPVTANTVEELADGLGIHRTRLRRTVDEFNKAVSAVEFDASKRDSKCTSGLNPEKSNWASPIDSPPYKAYAVACGITFTYGGLRIDPQCAVLTADDEPIPGLWAAGELTGGFFYHNYPSGSGLMRGSITGHVAATQAVKNIRGK